VVPEKSVQDHWVLLLTPPFQWVIWFVYALESGCTL
jgi:hypothetical protein